MKNPSKSVNTPSILLDGDHIELNHHYTFQEVEQDPQIGRIISENKPEWVCWQTGLQLQYLDTTLFSVK